FFQKSRAACNSSARTCTHWPRTLTSGDLSRASVSSSRNVNACSPRAICQLNFTTASSDKPPSLLRVGLSCTSAVRPSRCRVPCALRDGRAGGGRLAGRGQEAFPGLEAVPVQARPGPAVRVPHFGGGEEQAGVVLGLEQVADGPRAVGGEAVAVGLGVRLLQ